MKLYNVLIKKTEEGKIEDVITLKEGFAGWAFIFNKFWFLYHKMWKEFIALLILGFAFSYFCESGYLAPIDQILLKISFLLMIAFNANYWLIENLKKKNYEFAGVAFGSNYANAKMRFIKNMEDGAGFNQSEFDDAIINPKLHHKLAKMQRKLKSSEEYFSV